MRNITGGIPTSRTTFPPANDSSEVVRTRWPAFACLIAASRPPSDFAISTKARIPITMNTIVWNVFAHAAAREPTEHILQHHAADHQTRQPGRHRPDRLRVALDPREHVREQPRGHRPDHFPSTQNTDQQVRHDQADEDREQQVADPFRLEPVTEKLDLRDVAVLLLNDHSFNPIRKKHAACTSPEDEAIRP